MKGLASFIVTIGAIVLGIMLLAGFAIYIQVEASSLTSQVDASTLPLTASNDLVSALSYKINAFTTAQLIAGAYESGNLHSAYDQTMIAFNIIMRQRGCSNCLWFARISGNNIKEVYPSDIDDSTITSIINENKYYAVAMIPTTKGLLTAEYGAANTGGMK